jgi:hypothetical protein
MVGEPSSDETISSVSPHAAISGVRLTAKRRRTRRKAGMPLRVVSGVFLVIIGNDFAA